MLRRRRMRWCRDSLDIESGFRVENTGIIQTDSSPQVVNQWDIEGESVLDIHFNSMNTILDSTRTCLNASGFRYMISPFLITACRGDTEVQVDVEIDGSPIPIDFIIMHRMHPLIPVFCSLEKESTLMGLLQRMNLSIGILTDLNRWIIYRRDPCAKHEHKLEIANYESRKSLVCKLRALMPAGTGFSSYA
jgi:hypothetical protein